MTPIEELQAAHKRLSELREQHDRFYGAGVYFNYPAVHEYHSTLHRTIDAQLAILDAAITFEGIVEDGAGFLRIDAIRLARAINGVTS